MSVCVCVLILRICYVLFCFVFACSIWDPSSPTRDGTQPPALEAQFLNHWIAREVVILFSYVLLVASKAVYFFTHLFLILSSVL